MRRATPLVDLSFREFLVQILKTREWWESWNWLEMFPASIRILPHLEKSKLNLNLVDDAPSLDIVPWKHSVSTVCFDLASFIYNLSLNPFCYKKNSPTVLKQRKELLRRLYPQNKLKKNFYMSAFRRQFNICSRVEGYSFSSQTCLLFQRKTIFDIIWFPFLVTVYIKPKISSNLSSDFRIIYRNDKRGERDRFHLGSRACWH